MAGVHQPERLTGSHVSAELDKKSPVQSLAPVNEIGMHLCAFHFYNGDINRQLEAHHYCSHLGEEFFQCVIYDSPEATARLIGVEYIISRRLFESLDPEEQRYWHSHVYESKSGVLVTPGLPNDEENKVMCHVMDTYGKTIHTWQVDRGDSLPIGPPQLMMAVTQDGQLNKDILLQRDKKFNISTEEKKSSRKDLPTPEVNPHADAWQNGETYQLVFQKLTS